MELIKIAFIRKKLINGNLYYYLVENFWTEKGTRQKVLKYLGKAESFIENNTS